jgi:hypothetical protein
MKTRINYGGAVFWGFFVTVVDMLLGNFLYTNPIVANTFKRYDGLPAIRSIEYFGGLGNFITLQVVFGLIISAVFIMLYLLLYQSIPGTGWKKGLAFALIIGVVKAVPEAFNQWMLFNYPAILIETQLVNSFISLLVFCVLLSVVFERFKVITREEKQWTKKVKMSTM